MTDINELEPLLSPITAVQKLIEHFDNQGIVIAVWLPASWANLGSQQMLMPCCYFQLKISQSWSN